MLQSPVIGALSDTAGRRPFLIASMALGNMPVLVIFGHLTIGTSLYFYYPANIIGGGMAARTNCSYQYIFRWC